MIVYIEETFILNLLLNYIILYLVKKMSFNKHANKYLFLSSTFGSILTFFYQYLSNSPILLILFKTIISIVMIIIAFGYLGIKKNIYQLLLFYIVTAIFGGVIVAINYNFNINNNTISFILLSSILIFYIVNCLINTFLNKKDHYNFTYNILIENKNKQIEIIGYLDSGNNIRDSNGNPIFIINKDIFIKLFEMEDIIKIYSGNLSILNNPNYITIGTLNKKSKILTFTIDNLQILNKDNTLNINNPSIGISPLNLKKSFGCDMLLHSDIIRGIKQ